MSETIDHAWANATALRIVNGDPSINAWGAKHLARAYLALASEPRATLASERERDAWEKFGRAILREHMCHTEGVQDLAEECGVIVPVQVTEPCVPRNAEGEARGCNCYEADSIPGTCYRPIERHAPSPAVTITEAIVEAVRDAARKHEPRLHEVADTLTTALASGGNDAD